MQLESVLLKHEERISFALRSLYHSRGYAPYRMSKFEEYELYVKNKDFLLSPEVITFTDTNGKLMALKPDVTLSIVRSSSPAPGQVQKLYYDENVYRVSESAGGFREIRQAGLECIGTVDENCVGEVISLALESLRVISPESRLSVSLLGIVEAMLDGLQLAGEARLAALKCMGEKNIHELKAVCLEAGVAEADIERLQKLTLCAAAPREALPQLRALGFAEEALQNLRALADLLPPEDAGRVGLDFSILSDMRYYNDIAFQGYVRGVPSSVLSGGAYGRLLHRMGKSGGGIGFACYLDKLERVPAPGEREADRHA